MKNINVLIVEDENDIANIIRDYLSVHQFDSHIVRTGHEDGIEICRKIREHSNVAILILSARGSDTDKVLGLGFGADDYMTKPFSLSELVARINAHLRRQDRWLQDHDVQKDVIHIDNIVINKQEYLFLRDNKPIPLSAKEFELLFFLAKNRNQVFSKSQLLDAVWGYDTYGDENTITVYIRRLREKVEINPSHPVYLQTVWGVGYKFSTSNHV